MIENTKATRFSIWTRHFVVIVILNCLISCCMFFHNAVTTLFVVSIGGTAAYAGFMLTMFTISATITRFVAGSLVDRKGRRKVILVGLTIYAVTTASIGTAWLSYLPLARGLQGIGYSMTTIGLSVAITDILPVPRMGEGLGYSGLSNSLASAVGPVIAMRLYETSGSYVLVYFASVGIIAVAFILMFFCRYEQDTAFFERKRQYELEIMAQSERPAPAQESYEEKRGFFAQYFEIKAVPCMIVSFFLALGTAATVAYLMYYANLLGIANASLFYTLQAITTVLVRLLCGKISDKYGTIVSLIPGCLLLGLGYFFLLSAAKYNILFILAGALLGMGGGINMPALNAEAVRHVPQNRRGAASATYMVSMDVGIGVGGMFWGRLADGLGFKYVFGGCMVCVAIALLLSFLLFSKKRVSA